MLGRLSAAVVAATLAVGCKPPDPPTLEAKEIRVTAVGPQGLDVLARIEATNPNKVELAVRSVSATVKLANKYQLGMVTLTKPVALPPRAPTMIEAPMTLPWADVSTLGMLAMTPGPVPYVVSGTVNIGGDRLNVNLPFTIQGTLTRDQLAGAAVKGLPPGLGNLIPH